MSRFLFALILIQAATATLPPAPQTPGNVTPGNITPGNATPGTVSPATPPATVVADPAAVTFTTDVGLLMVAVKPTMVTEYEAAIIALQGALAVSTDAEMQKLAKGWRVFKATDLDAKSNAIYVHVLQPTVASADYRPSMLLDKLLSGAPLELLAKYRDSFAVPPTKLALTEFANMSVAPVAKPTNASPATPTAPKPPK